MPLPLAAVGALIGGGTKIIGSLIGGGKRRREARRAEAEYNQQKAAFQNFQFTNEYKGMENVFEDATINQQATQFQAQQTDQALAQSLQAATMAGGGAGGAQAIAQAALQSKQGIAADIAQQEAANRAAMLSQEAALQSAEAQADMAIQDKQYGQTQQLLNMASGRKNAADAARARATQQLVSGIGTLGFGVAQAIQAKGGEKGGDAESTGQAAIPGSFSGSFTNNTQGMMGSMNSTNLNFTNPGNFSAFTNMQNPTFP